MKNECDRDEEVDEDSGSVTESSASQEEDGVEKQIRADKSKPVKRKKKKASNGNDAKSKKTLSRLKGQRVIARCNLDGYYYAGHILSCSSADKAVVDFDELDRSVVHSKHVIPISGSIARPFIKEGDAVLVLVKNAITGLHCHVPGLVVMAPRADNAQAKFYRILAYNRRYVSAMRYQLVKISAPKFRTAVDYIIERAKQLGLTAVAPPPGAPTGSRHHSAVSQSVASEDAVFASSLPSVKRKPRLYSAGGSVDDQQQQQRKRHHRHHHRDSIGTESQLRESDNNEALLSVITTPSTGPRHGSASSLPPHRSSAPQPPLNSNGNHQLCDKCTQATAIVHFISPSDNQDDGNDGERRLKDRAVSPISFLSPKIEEESTPRNNSGEKSRSAESPPPSLEEDEDPGSHRNRRFKASVVTIPYGDFAGNDNANNTPSSDKPPIDGTFKIGQNVLARFPDDGWYYLCAIEHDVGDGSYIVRDRTDDTEIVWKEDIIDATDERPLPFRVGELVIAEHPTYPRSYCPGVVIADENEHRFNQSTEPGRVFVRFYDAQESKVDRRGCYIITHSKFDDDILYIVHCEQRWVGQDVVVKNAAGIFELGRVLKRFGDGRVYAIELANRDFQGNPVIIKQTSTNIFGRFTKPRQLRIGDRVLALYDPEKREFLPGTIRSIFDPSKHRPGPGSYRNSSQSSSSPALALSPHSRSSADDERQPLLTVKFINGAIVNGLMLVHAFFLNNEYFTEAEQAYRQAVMSSNEYSSYAKGALKLGDIGTEQITNKLLNIQLKQPQQVIVIKQEDEVTTTTSATVATPAQESSASAAETTENTTDDIAEDDGEDDDSFNENEETADEEETNGEA